jgi:tetratricopeptide (TPR) repeat protein
MRARVAADPSRFDDWKALADTYEWSGDVAGMTEALEGAVSARPEDSAARLRLAYGEVRLGRLGEARDVLEKLDREEVQHDADHPFCVGAVAEWEGDTATALREYDKAARMRTYRPVYHLRYGSLLKREGRAREARRELRWAARIDAVGDVQREAERLLSGLETE